MATLSGLSPLNPISGLKTFEKTDLGATPDENVMAGAATLYTLDIDARNNTGEDVSYKAVNATTFTVGTDASHLKIRVRAGIKQSIAWYPGKAFGTGISQAVVKESADSGTTAPSGDVDVVGYVS